MPTNYFIQYQPPILFTKSHVYSSYKEQLSVYYKYLFLLILHVVFNEHLVQAVSTDQCLYQSDGITLLNSVHEIYLNSTCLPCLPYCTTCNSQADSSCANGNCQNGYYLQVTNSSYSSCQSCPVLCKACDNFSIQSCLQCIDSYYFDSYLLNCVQCPYGALSCSGSVILQCKVGFYYDSQGSLCKSCQGFCASCISSSQCDFCENGYYFTQGSICSQCGVSNCKACADNTSCYQCNSGYQLLSSNNCSKFNKCGSNCQECLISNSLICTLCYQSYYLYNGKCYFGSSFLCISGCQGPTFSRCSSCSLIGQISSFGQSSTYCIPTLSITQQQKIQFYTYPAYLFCQSPYFKSSTPSYQNSINLFVEPLYQISLKMVIISTSSIWKSVNISLSDLNNLGTYTFLSQSITSGPLFCQSDVMNGSGKTVFKVQQSYFIKSLSQNIKLSINSSLSTFTMLSVVELYLLKYLCLSENCQACYSTYYCSVCKTSYLLQEYSCVKNCSQGYYTNSQLGKCQIQCSVGFYSNMDFVCQSCQSQCISCTDLNLCSICSTGFYLDKNICTQNCSKNTTFQDSSLNFCSMCKNPCKTCKNIGSNCTSCLVGYLFEPTFQCIQQCPKGYFSSFQNNIPKCLLCSNSCLTCQILSDYCSSCKTGLYLENGICNTNCPSGYYRQQFQNKCSQCVGSCQTCQFLPNNCKSCYQGFLLQLFHNQLALIGNDSKNLNFQTVHIINFFQNLNSSSYFLTSNLSFGICVNQCPQFYFFQNQTTSSCQRCPIDCHQCSSSSICSSCNKLSSQVNQTFLYNNKCVKICSSFTYYMNIPTLYCKNCKKPCFKCLTDYTGTNCLSCIQGYFLYINTTSNSSLQAGICLLRCPYGFYKSQSTITCQVCPLECKQCESETKCTVCSIGYIFTSQNYSCTKSNCSSSYYLTLAMECQQCNSNCKQCETVSYFCTQCNNHQYLMVNSGVCVDSCPDSYFLAIMASNISNQSATNNSVVTYIFFCQVCKAPCQNCQNQTICSSCIQNYYLNDFECIQQCPDSFYKNNLTNVCQKCPNTCRKCFSFSYCTDCSPGLILIFNQCYTACRDGYFANKTIQNTTSCSTCPIQCLTCESQSNCSSCSYGYFFELSSNSTGQCVSQCKNGYFKNLMTSQCEACKYPCNLCLNQIICISCQSNLIYLNSACYEACPNSFYFQNSTNTCRLCQQSSCSVCTSLIQCSKCKSPYYLFQNTINQTKNCITNCPSGYFQDNVKNQCVKCQPPCVTCYNSVSCISCVPSYYLKDGSCLSACPVGSYSYNDNQVGNQNYSCLVCSINCLSCQSQSLCNICHSNFYLYQNLTQTTCVSTCPTTTYLNWDSYRCQSCSNKCQECINDQFTCTLCQKSLFLQRNICVQNCSQFYYPLNNTTCLECPKWCSQCTNSTLCLKCVIGYLFEGQCVINCPDGTYKNNENYKCSACMAGCLKCKSQTVCLNCSSSQNYSLYSIKCVQKPCPSNLLYWVDQNSCITKCNYLTDFINTQCHSSDCPVNLIKSTDSKYCLQSCPSNQYISLQNNINNDSAFYLTSVCKMLYELQLPSTLTQLPDFKIQTMCFKGKIIVFMFFNYQAIQLAQSKNNQIKTLKSMIQSQICITIDALNSTSLNIMKVESQLKAKRKLQQAVRLNSVQWEITQIRSNGIWIQIITLTDQQTHKPVSPMSVLNINVNFKHPYQYFSVDLSNDLKIPLQSYSKASILKGYLPQSQSNISRQAGRSLFLIFACLTLLTIILYAGFSDKFRSYMFVNCIEYQQFLYLFCFLSVNYPIGLQSFFESYSIFHIRWIFTQEVQQSDFDPNRKLVQSPVQYYKIVGDISFFDNILDICLVIVITIFVVIITKVFSTFPNPFKDRLKKVNNNRKKILQALGWLIVSYLGLFAMINTFYKPNFINSDSEYLFQIIICYFIMILVMVSSVYVFYFQYHDKQAYDTGIDSQKKKIGVSIPLYIYLRKILFIFFLTYYYDNGVYPLCISMMSTAMIFIIIFWYAPYRSYWRNHLAVLQEGLLFVVLALLLIQVLNPQYGSWLQFILIFFICSLILSTLLYPIYCLYSWLKYQQNPQSFEQNKTQNQSGLQNMLSQKEQKNNLDQQQQSYQINTKKGQTIYQNNQNNIHKMMFDRPPLCTNNAGLSQADESQLQQKVKKPQVKNIQNYNVIRLAKKQQKKVKQFKNYVISDNEDDLSSQKQSQSKINENEKKSAVLKKDQINQMKKQKKYEL